ncbi:hypothetical protein [Pseudomonas brassicacearum]|nr:hypothetical protein [Pseudomonas brassicacearum]
MHRIDGPGATVDHLFTDGDPVSGTQATMVTDDWLNDVQENIISVLLAAGVTPVKGRSSDLLDSLRKLSTSVVGGALNARMTVASASASATLTADEVVVKSALGGAAWTLSVFNKTINLGAAPGPGGMDTGSSPASGYLAIYAIYNPTTGVSALLAKNATSAVQTETYSGANMPSGYTASALVSVWPTNGGGQFVVGVMQGRQVAAGGIQVLSSSVQQASFVSLSLSAAVPLNAKTAKGYMRIGSSSPGNNLGQISANSVGLDQTIIEGGYTNATSAFSVAMLTPQTLFYTATTSAGTLNSLIVISSYTF